MLLPFEAFFLFMQINTPFFKKRANPSGVYKITIDDIYFYIGGSECLRNRMAKWRFELLNKHPKNKGIKNLLTDTSVIQIDILEIVEDPSDLRDLEDLYIRYNLHNPFLLNRCPSAKSNKGLKYLPEEKIRLKNNTGAGRKRRVAKVSADGTLMEEFESCSDAARKIGCSSSSIHESAKGVRKTAKGFIFKYIS